SAGGGTGDPTPTAIASNKLDFFLLENRAHVHRLADDVALVGGERGGGRIVDAQLPAFAYIHHVAAGNRLYAGDVVTRRRTHRRGECHRSGAGVVDGEAAVDNVAAGARADEELVVGAERDSGVNAVADNRAAAGSKRTGINRLHRSLRRSAGNSRWHSTSNEELAAAE